MLASTFIGVVVCTEIGRLAKGEIDRASNAVWNKTAGKVLTEKMMNNEKFLGRVLKLPKSISQRMVSSGLLDRMIPLAGLCIAGSGKDIFYSMAVMPVSTPFMLLSMGTTAALTIGVTMVIKSLSTRNISKAETVSTLTSKAIEGNSLQTGLRLN